MKRFIFLLAFLSFSLTQVQAQSDDQMKLDNLKYYLSSINDYLESMRYYADSVKMIDLINQMSMNAKALEEELNNVVIPEEISSPTDMEITEDVIVEETPEVDWGQNEDIYATENNNDDTGIGVSKFMPFKKKFNTSLKIEFGINTLVEGNSSPSGIISPEINTGGSWYWDFSLMRTARLGGKNSKVALNYGISYLKNRFKLDNDVRLSTNTMDDPEFLEVANLKSNPKLNVGYISIPLSFRFALSKKTKLELGGYAGYRIHTVQKFHLKTDNETIYEARYARHHLNNWTYGATASLDVSGFDIIFRYNFSKLFKDNPNYDYNTLMVGTSVSLF